MSKLRSSVVVPLAFSAAFIGLVAQAAVTTSAVAPEFVKNSALAWYDAADSSTITADANGVVSAWADKSAHNRTATTRADTSFWSAPVRTTAFGCPCLDFGCVGSRCDLVYERMTTIRTVFLVGRFGQDEHVFLLGDDTEYHFHRGSKGEYFNGQHAKHSRAWNGLAEVANTTATKIPEDTPQFIACEMKQNCCSGTLTNDRNCDGTTRNGGRHLFEVIIFDRVLTDDERSAVMTYLQTKWQFDHDPTPYRQNFRLSSSRAGTSTATIPRTRPRRTSWSTP